MLHSLRPAGGLCWEPTPLFEADAPGGTKELLNDAREAKCHVCNKWLPQKQLFGRPSDQYVRRDPLFRQYWVCTSCVLERDWTPSTPTGGRDVCSSISRPLTPADESCGPRRSCSLPGLPAGAIAAAALRAGESTPMEGRRAKPRPPRLVDDEMLSSSPLPSPAGSLAQAGVALIHDAASERSRSSAGSPKMGNTWTEAPCCQVCSKVLSLSSRSAALEATENRVCNACEAKRELNEVSLRRTSSKTVWPARGNGDFSSSWELIDFSASK